MCLEPYNPLFDRDGDGKLDFMEQFEMHNFYEYLEKNEGSGKWNAGSWTDDEDDEDDEFDDEDGDE